jgi:hypothetical protein
LRTLLALAALLLCAGTLHATPYWTDEDAERARQQPFPETARDLSPRLRGDTDYLSDFFLSAWFIASMQVTDTTSADYGGIREGEALLDVIQTDNTSESIWVFSRYYELTGDTDILPYLDASWVYVLNHPAYDEEGSSFPSTGYYRYYNCGWAVRAGMKYKQVFSDATHQAYVDSCASYIATRTLNLAGSQFHQDVNPPILGWGGANLRAYAAFEGNSDWLDKAASKGGRVKDWVEADPAILSTEEWAVSGGAAMWGILESYFDANPGEEAAWVATYAAQMDTVATPGDFENAWQGWYALAHHSLEESTGDPIWGVRHQFLTDYLLSFDDTDQDGGIQANPTHTDMEDEAWVTAYLEFMGLEPLLGDAVAAPLVSRPAPSGALLLAGRPNPFSSTTSVPFRLREDGRATVEVFDLAGRRVARLADGPRSAGEHAVAWDGRDDSGRPVPAGVYFCRLRAGGIEDARRLVLLR